MPLTPSSTREIPETEAIPKHIAIIMDGNGRWAKQRYLPRIAGHTQGVEAVRGTIKACIERGVSHLTIFAFSSENWRRPAEEIRLLMQLFLAALEREITSLHENGVRFRVIGDLTKFDPKIIDCVRHGEALTASNTRLYLTVAANYGGRWDIMQAIRKMIAENPDSAVNFDESDIASHLTMADAPEPDLFIRTGGECRISNFLLWQLAYTELYFTDTLWPDFNASTLDEAIRSYQKRERRFGRTSEQLEKQQERQQEIRNTILSKNKI
ncbi:di-trans,poly-cis-decaprenylcistransferase [Nitrosomonas sp. HPC101]|uniref:polyprenyl diphosphate synthase n=1 Tax=Nitrosomonas sp. HPC101 TaxID=1658667 RepID=UPI00137155BA|nr:polyprenyl diphosphate synthase [Nitrosomonas sp. HPC101]MXS85101.1 di-trans,poly-cis-decaprenylcistransferase [Nitrosomonas sp. HPC101]